MTERRSAKRGSKRSSSKRGDGAVIDVDATGEVHLADAAAEPDEDGDEDGDDELE